MEKRHLQQTVESVPRHAPRTREDGLSGKAMLAMLAALACTLLLLWARSMWNSIPAWIWIVLIAGASLALCILLARVVIALLDRAGEARLKWAAAHSQLKDAHTRALEVETQARAHDVKLAEIEQRNRESERAMQIKMAELAHSYRIRMEELKQIPFTTQGTVDADGQFQTMPAVHVEMERAISTGRAKQIAQASSSAHSTLIIPDEYDLMDVIRRFPLSEDNMFLGRMGDRREVAVNPQKELCHGAFNAITGRGKTIVIRGIEPQLLTLGLEVVHADIKFALVDEKGNDYKPIAKRLLDQGNIAGTNMPHLLLQPDPIREMIRWLANTEIERRLDFYHQGYADQLSVFYLFLEELAYMHRIYKKDGLSEDLDKILVVGRSLGIKVFTSAQNFQSQNSGINTGSRENFESAWYLGGDDKSGAALLDIGEKELRTTVQENDIRLGRGVMFFRNNTVVPEATIMRAGMASNEFVYHLLGHADDFRIPPELTGNGKREVPETRYTDNLRGFQSETGSTSRFPSHGASGLVDTREALPVSLPTRREVTGSLGNAGSTSHQANGFLPKGDDKFLPEHVHEKLFAYYRVEGTVNGALEKMGIKNSRYKRHAKYLVDQWQGEGR